MTIDDFLLEVDNLLNFYSAATIVNDNFALIKLKDEIVCEVEIKDDFYKISHSNSEWIKKTEHDWTKADGYWYYYMDTIDECIGELQHLLSYLTETKKNNSKEHTSQLSKIVTQNAFEIAYSHFIEQADKNYISKKGEGSRLPYGFSSRVECDRKEPFGIRYGQGAASTTPYMNWWVVSIYYTPRNGEIILGIECERYPGLKNMKIKPLENKFVGKKKVTVFYRTYKSTLNYEELYEKFISVAEDIMRIEHWI